LAGTVLGKNGPRAGGVQSLYNNNSPSSPNNPPQATSGQDRSSAAANAQNSSATAQGTAAQTAPSSTDSDFAAAAESIRQAMQQMPDIAELSRQVMVEQTPEGLRIQLVDQDQRPMFAPGTSQPMPYTRQMLQAVAKIIDRLPNRIAISGHTDGQPYTAPDGSTNWELSAARANVARSIITAAGVNPDRISEVAGKAGAEPLLPEDPNASANRRISILLLKEAPPVPAGIKP
jgi:chemotaxis protein MotB